MTIRLLIALLVISMVGCSSERDGEGDAGGGPPDAAPDAGSDAGVGPRVFFDDGFDPSIAERFERATTGAVVAPVIVYPESGTLVPPNMLGVDLHFRAAVLQAFEITYAQQGEPSVIVYARCAAVGDGCVFQPWGEVWAELAARRRAGPYTIRIRGLAGERVSEPSAAIELELADEAIEGGLYYASATDHPPSIRRHELGLARRSAERYLDADEILAGLSVSRDGSRIAVGSYEEASTTTVVYDVASRTRVSTFESETAYSVRYGPGHDLVLSAPLADLHHEQTIELVRGDDGSTLHRFEVGPGHSADWSPDGSRVVYDLTVGMRGFLFLFDLMLIEEVDGAWQPPRQIPTPGIIGAYSPSFAPDSDWLGFTALDSTDQDPATGTFAPLLVATRVSDGRYVRLRRALGDVNRHHERPELLRWNPSPYSHGGRRIYWLTFSTARQCGLLPAIDHEFTGGRQIWMAAFDPEADPDDPSRPAFRVPAQRWRLDNRMGEWALTVSRPPCATDEDCPAGELCIDGFCYEAPE